MSTLVRQKSFGTVGGELRRAVRRAGKMISHEPTRSQGLLRKKLEASEAYLNQLKKGSDGCKHDRLPATYSSVAQVRATLGASLWEGLSRTITTDVKRLYLNGVREESIRTNLAKLYVLPCCLASIGAISMIGGIGMGKIAITENSGMLLGSAVPTVFLGLIALVVGNKKLDEAGNELFHEFRACQKLVKELDSQQPFGHVDSPRDYLPMIEQSLNVTLGELRARFDSKWEQLQGWKKSVDTRIDDVKGKGVNVFGGEIEKRQVLASLDHRAKEIESAMSEFKAQCLDPLKKLRTDLLPVKMAEVEARVQKYEADLAEYQHEQDIKKQRAEMQAEFVKLGMPRDLSRANKAMRIPEFTIDDILSAFDDELDAFVDNRREYLQDSYGKPAGNGRLFQNGEVSISYDPRGGVSKTPNGPGRVSVRP